MHNLKQLLNDRLQNIGLEQNLIPGFIRCLANSIYLKPNMELYQIRKQLEFMGWNDFVLDYHTLQLAKTCLELEGLDSLVYKSKNWFINNFVN
jgi:hypothetical protein